MPSDQPTSAVCVCVCMCVDMVTSLKSKFKQLPMRTYNLRSGLTSRQHCQPDFSKQYEHLFCTTWQFLSTEKLCSCHSTTEYDKRMCEWMRLTFPFNCVQHSGAVFQSIIWTCSGKRTVAFLYRERVFVLGVKLEIKIDYLGLRALIKLNESVGCLSEMSLGSRFQYPGWMW